MEQREPYRVALPHRVTEPPRDVYIYVGSVYQQRIIIMGGSEQKVVELAVTADGQVTVYGGQKVTVYRDGKVIDGSYLSSRSIVVVLPREVGDSEKGGDEGDTQDEGGG